MIKVTSLRGSEMFINSDLIERIIQAPDTVITLANGNSYVVSEPAHVLFVRIADYKAHILRAATTSIGKYK
jgi:flagellar protein FlbD